MSSSSAKQLEIVQKIVEQPLDFTSTSNVNSNNDAMEQMLKLQNQQFEQMKSMMDKNNDYFPNDQEVDDMKKKQAAQANQINILLEKLSKQKSDPKIQSDPEVAKQLAAFEEQLKKAKEQSDNLNQNINSKQFEEIQVQKLEKIESLKKLDVSVLQG